MEFVFLVLVLLWALSFTVFLPPSLVWLWLASLPSKQKIGLSKLSPKHSKMIMKIVITRITLTITSCTFIEDFLSARLWGMHFMYFCLILSTEPLPNYKYIHYYYFTQKERGIAFFVTCTRSWVRKSWASFESGQSGSRHWVSGQWVAFAASTIGSVAEITDKGHRKNWHRII